MMDEGNEKRLTQIEKRLTAIENLLRRSSTASEKASGSDGFKSAPPLSSDSTPQAQPIPVAPLANEGDWQEPPYLLQPNDGSPISSQNADSDSVSPASLMAAGAVGSFVLAAVYFLGLLAHNGWLTPPIQLLIATGSGVGLIIAGLGLARFDRQYAAYLPAVGVIVLYLTVYAGQLFHHLLSPTISSLFICLITVAALALGQKFKRDSYSISAVVGVYVSPILLQSGAAVGPLITFYAIWCLVFCGLAVQSGNRRVYLVAAYLAMFSFDASFRLSGNGDWMSHANFQLFQFFLFLTAATLISIRSRVPMTEPEAVRHAPALFCFYLIEFAIFKSNAPHLFPVIGLASVLVVVSFYFIARRFLDPSRSNAGATLVSAYASIVSAHIIFFELLPFQMLPWGALAVGVMASIAMQRFGDQRALKPVWIVAAIVCLAGGCMALFDAFPGNQRHTSPVILPIYAAFLYAAFWNFHRLRAPEISSTLSLYSGHIALMVAIIRILDSQLWISVAWGFMAVTLLLVAWKMRIRVLGQSSLFIFAISSMKLVIYDLIDSNSMIRISVLLVMAVSFYLGGWLYKQLSIETMSLHGDDPVEGPIHLILELSHQGMSSLAIAKHLIDRDISCAVPSGWDAVMVEEIIANRSST